MKLAKVLIGFVAMMDSACGAQESVPNLNIWHSYTNMAVGFEVTFQLPDNAREIVSPQSISDLSGDPGFGTIFDVGYDFERSSLDVPKFQVSMQVHEFVSELEMISVKEFALALANHEKYVTLGSLNSSEPTASQWLMSEIDNFYFALHEGEKSLSYSILLNKKYFLRVTGSFGRFARKSDEWVSNRRSLYKKLVKKIVIRRAELE